MRFLTRKCKTNKCKTRKNKNVKGKQFVKKLLQEFKNKKFYVKHDTIDGEGHCINDYYLNKGNKHNYDEHIHLILNNYKKDENNNYNFGYIFKKYNKSYTYHIHSEYVKINIDDDYKKLVSNMIKEYQNFLLK